MDLALRAIQQGIQYRVIHNESIMNAIGCCGLQVCGVSPQGRSQSHRPGWARVPLSSFFSSNFDYCFSFFLKLYIFSSSFWPFGWASRPSEKPLATPLYLLLPYKPDSWTPLHPSSPSPNPLPSSLLPRKHSNTGLQLAQILHWGPFNKVSKTEWMLLAVVACRYVCAVPRLPNPFIPPPTHTQSHTQCKCLQPENHVQNCSTWTANASHSACQIKIQNVIHTIHHFNVWLTCIWARGIAKGGGQGEKLPPRTLQIGKGEKSGRERTGKERKKKENRKRKEGKRRKRERKEKEGKGKEKGREKRKGKEGAICIEIWTLIMVQEFCLEVFTKLHEFSIKFHNLPACDRGTSPLACTLGIDAPPGNFPILSHRQLGLATPLHLGTVCQQFLCHPPIGDGLLNAFWPFCKLLSTTGKQNSPWLHVCS